MSDESIRRYIPQKLLQSVKAAGRNHKNDEKVVHAILSNSDDMLRMYGTARELLLNLRRFQNFPLSHRYFGFDSKEPYSTIPVVYENMDGVPFMNKADAFCLLQNLVVKDFLETPKSFALFRSMQAILLKSHEEKIKGICEFFKYDKAWWGRMQHGFSSIQKQAVVKVESLRQIHNFMSEEWSYENALKMFKIMLPVWNQQEYCEFEKD
ncbi:hypothetical protein B9Z55_009232 [Caenorhabditis nigoni]|uniref:DUF7809 domain-containing protein n=1 Tax=Caenorhabditis nigoni TaxID=1611254 RepID=A0A2G5URF1_9PELO|nr:hypothetical protein B9Z55_009232 [Caenorhabditis nigoni]